MKWILLPLICFIFVSASIVELKKDKFEPPSQPLTTESYKNLEIKYLTLASQKDFQQALEQIWADLKTDDSVSRACHSIVHELGRSAFEKTNNFTAAIKLGNETCNSGFIHGIIESYFSQTPDVYEAMKSLCAEYPENKHTSWECFHGIGHGLMYFNNNNLPKSVEKCETLPSSFGITACVNGVYMENFNTDQKLHTSSFLKTGDPFYPCLDQPEKYKSDCYLYAPTYFLSLNQNAYEAALEWCKTAPTETYLKACITGVGAQATKENLNNPKLTENLCSQAKENIESCLHGILGIHAFQFGTLEALDEVCSKLSLKAKSACESYKTRTKTFFE